MNIKSNWKNHIKKYFAPTIFKESLLKPYFEKLNLKGNVLDIGCGTGYFSEILSSKNVKVTGIDQNKVNIKSEVKYLQGDGKSLPFEKNSFQNILIINVLSCIDSELERIKVLSEAKRIKTKEGKIYVINGSEELFENDNEIVNSKKISESKGILKLKKIDGNYIEFEDYIISSNNMKKYVEKSNLEIIEIKDFIYDSLNLKVYTLYVLK